MSFEVEISLPSRNRLYHNVDKDAKVKIRPFRGEAEEFLAGSVEDDTTYPIRMAVEKVITLPANLRYSELLVTDWAACVAQAVGISFASQFPVEPKCGKCGHVNYYVVKFREMEETTPEHILRKMVGKTEKNGRENEELTEEDWKRFQEPFIIPPSPLEEHKFAIKLLRVGDLARIEDYVKDRKNKGLSNRTRDGNYALAQQIVTINDQPQSDMQKMQFLFNMITGDKRYLRKAIDDRDTGLELQPTIPCAKCGSFLKVDVPITRMDFLETVYSTFGEDSGTAL